MVARSQHCPCSACAHFWKPSVPSEDPGAPTVSDLVTGLYVEVDLAEKALTLAHFLRDEAAPDSVVYKHAQEWMRIHDARRVQAQRDRRRWRSYVLSHPHLANKSIDVKCEHVPAHGGIPSCWDPDRWEYTAETAAAGVST